MALALIFFFSYLLIVVCIGFISSRRESEEDFMIAERSIGGFQTGVTMSAGFVGGGILSIFFAYIYQYGFAAVWIFFGLAAGFIFLLFYAASIKKMADMHKVYSMPEYFYRVLGKRNGLMFSVMLLVQFFLILTVDLIISAKVLSTIFPLPYYLSVCVGGCIILSYLLLAGFRAVVRTDFFQLLLTFIMALSAGLYLLGQVHQPAFKLELGGMGLGNTIGFLILGGFGVVVAPDIWQRIFSAREEKSLKRGLITAAIILPVLASVLSIAALATRQLLPSIAPEDALIVAFSFLLPIGLKELGTVLLYAVSLSSSDTITFVVSSIMTRDLQNYGSKYREESMRHLTRIFMVLFVVMALGLAILYHDIVQLGFAFASLNLALFPVVIGSLHWKLHEGAVFWSLVLASASVPVLFVANALTPETAVISLPVAFVSLMVLQKVASRNSAPCPGVE